jgi:TolB protein
MKKTVFYVFLNAILTAFAMNLLFPVTAPAKVYIDLSAPAVKKLPVILKPLRYSGSGRAKENDPLLVAKTRDDLQSTLKGDLRFSDLFAIVENEKASTIADMDLQGIEMMTCREAGSDLLLKGSFTIADKALVAEMTILDCLNEREVMSRRYYGSVASPGRLMHYFLDQLYEEMTGRQGIFSTRLLFVSDKTGNKEVYISDYDGRNARQITRNGSINLSPQWSPDGKKMLYISYKTGSPALHMLDLLTGKDRVISERQGLNIAGRFSPDSSRIALTMSADKSPELYLIDASGREVQRLTDNFSIDVSPSWSPDGSSIAYTSDASGNPHIYIMNIATKEAKRITFNGKYNSSPSWSPDGSSIAFSRNDGAGRFNIWVIRPDGTGEAQLTFEGDNKSPSWSPDGRFIIFSSKRGNVSSLYIMRADGTGLFKLPTAVGGETMPAWSPFLR